MKDIYPHQEAVTPRRSLIERLAQSRVVQITGLSSALLMLAACGDDNGLGDAVPGVEVKSNVLVIANADGFPNTAIQCITDTAIFSNTRTGGPQVILDDEPDLCAAVALTLKNHPGKGDDAVLVPHLDCPAEALDPNLATQMRLEPTFGLCG